MACHIGRACIGAHLRIRLFGRGGNLIDRSALHLGIVGQRMRAGGDLIHRRRHLLHLIGNLVESLVQPCIGTLEGFHDQPELAREILGPDVAVQPPLDDIHRHGLDLADGPAEAGGDPVYGLVDEGPIPAEAFQFIIEPAFGIGFDASDDLALGGDVILHHLVHPLHHIGEDGIELGRINVVMDTTGLMGVRHLFQLVDQRHDLRLVLGEFRPVLPFHQHAHQLARRIAVRDRPKGQPPPADGELAVMRIGDVCHDPALVGRVLVEEVDGFAHHVARGEMRQVAADFLFDRFEHPVARFVHEAHDHVGISQHHGVGQVIKGVQHPDLPGECFQIPVRQALACAPCNRLSHRTVLFDTRSRQNDLPIANQNGILQG